MIAAFAPAFPGNLERLADTLSLADSDGDIVPCHDLLQPDVLLQEIARLAPIFPDASRSDLAVVWARVYSARLLTVVFPTVILDLELPVSLEESWLIVNGTTGYPAALRLANAGASSRTADPFRRFAPLIRDHLEPVLEAVALHGRASTKVIWGNTATNFESFARRATIAAAEAGKSLTCDALALAGASHWPDGWKNPLHEPYFPQANVNAQRVRKTCCLHYRLRPGAKLCGACPILEKQNRRAGCETSTA